ncbi:MAG: hypothetical protein V1863_06955 [Candidatus Omnitrophota bacterium]
MEILILILALGVVGVLGYAFKFTSDEEKQKQAVEDGKSKKISDLEAQAGRLNAGLKKATEERQKLEDEFFKFKDEADITKRENEELLNKIKQLEKAKEEASYLKGELKQKDLMLQQETVARQKLQGELSIAQNESDKFKAEVDAKTKMHEGLKGQFEELENELLKLKFSGTQPQKAKEAAADVIKPVEPKPVESKPPAPKPVEEQKPQEAKQEKVPPAPQAPKVDKPVESKPPAPPKPPEPEKPKEVVLEKPKEPKQDKGPIEPEAPKAFQPFEIKPPVSKSSEPPLGFPPQSAAKIETKKDVPSDTDFLQAKSAPKPAEPIDSGIQEGAFKITNVNKPKPPEQPPEKKEPEKDKSKHKRETLIPGFQPKKESPHEPAE